MTKAVERWPHRSDEQVDQQLSYSREANLFEDYGWTTPPISAIEVVDTFEFNGESMAFHVDSGELFIDYQGEQYRFTLQTSNGDIFPDISYLEQEMQVVHRWEPKTEIVVEHVLVTKTRTVPVTSFNADGSTSTSFQTEVYTEMEFHSIPKTTWQWVVDHEMVYVIPNFDHYNITIGDKINLILYPLTVNNRLSYYLQNPTYIASDTSESTFWGERDVKILLMDSNANGHYLDSEDHILFNLWNPYDQNSSFRQIRGIRDNLWAYTEVFENDLLLTFQLQDDYLFVSNQNSEFVGSDERGTLVIQGLEKGSYRMEINGSRYNSVFGNSRPIEYGNYNIRIIVDGHVDYFDVFHIDSEYEEHTIDYTPTAAAAPLKIRNIFSNQYYVTLISDGFNHTYFNTNEINLPMGNSTLQIYVNGFLFEKEYNLTDRTPLELDYEEEIKNLDLSN